MVFALMMGSLTVFSESLASVKSVVGEIAMPPRGSVILRSRSAKRVARVKLTPAVSDISAIARACEEAGADALSAVNTFVGMSFDLGSGQPRLAFRSGGLSGPAIRPLALYLAYQVARAVSIPVVGIGGIARAEDAMEFLLAGCRAVQVGTATFVDPNAIGKIAAGISLPLVGKDPLAQSSDRPLASR